MTFYQGLATVLLRVWAATMLVAALRRVIDFGIWWSSQSESVSPETDQYLLGSLASSATYLVLCIAVWICALPFGRWAGGAISAAEPAITLAAAQLVTIGSFLIGLFVLVEYAPQAMMDTVIALIKNARTSDAERLSGTRIDLLDLRNVAMHWAVVVAALALAFRARDIGRLFGWLREAGLPKPEPASD